MKSKKKKALISLLIIVGGLLFNTYFSTIIHLLLTKKITTLEISNFKYCLESIASSKQHLMLFLYLYGFIVLFAVFFFVANDKPYQSDLKQITPKISTPVSAGQKQFGSAEWLSEKEKDLAFQSFILNTNDSTVTTLIKQGYDDLQEIMKGSVCYKALLPQGGIVLGCRKVGGKEKVFFIGEDVHSLCIGATRSGKTRTVVLQSIANIALAGESMILSDPKGGTTRF